MLRFRRHGPARLLWVNVEDEAHANGTIEHVREGLYRGWIDHLAPHSNAFDYRPRSWLNLLEHARTCTVSSPELVCPIVQKRKQGSSRVQSR